MFQSGWVGVKRLRDCHLFHAGIMPKITLDFLDSYEETGPYGGKSVGECAVVPSAAAVINAVSNAIDIDFYKLPVKPKDVLMQCRGSDKIEAN